jgi:hypothetical protein
LGWASNEEYFRALRSLIDRWCDERKLGALSQLLPGYLAFNGLADGWADLLASMNGLRAFGRDAFSDEDWNLLQDFIREAERIVYRS